MASLVVVVGNWKSTGLGFHCWRGRLCSIYYYSRVVCSDYFVCLGVLYVHVMNEGS